MSRRKKLEKKTNRPSPNQASKSSGLRLTDSEILTKVIEAAAAELPQEFKADQTEFKNWKDGIIEAREEALKNANARGTRVDVNQAQASLETARRRLDALEQDPRKADFWRAKKIADILTEELTNHSDPNTLISRWSNWGNLGVIEAQLGRVGRLDPERA